MNRHRLKLLAALFCVLIIPFFVIYGAIGAWAFSASTAVVFVFVVTLCLSFAGLATLLIQNVLR